jgi:hypothetical protein
VRDNVFAFGGESQISLGRAEDSPAHGFGIDPVDVETAGPRPAGERD